MYAFILRCYVVTKKDVLKCIYSLGKLFKIIMCRSIAPISASQNVTYIYTDKKTGKTEAKCFQQLSLGGTVMDMSFLNYFFPWLYFLNLLS